MNFRAQTRWGRAGNFAAVTQRAERQFTDDYPRVLVVTKQSVCPAHGIGAVLLRHFGQYDPSRLANVFISNDGAPPWAFSLQARRRSSQRWSKRWAERLALRMTNQCARVVGLNAGMTGMARYFRPVRPELNAMKFHPDVIYSNCFCDDDLSLTWEISKEYNHAIPLIQHFHDYMPDEGGDCEKILRKLLPRCDSVWVLSEGIGNELKTRFGCSAKIVNTFKVEVAPELPRVHRPVDKSFRAVMVGNVHYTPVLEDVRRLWRGVQARVPGLGPIEWVGSSRQVERCRESETEFEPEVEFVGFKPDLQGYLAEADLAIIPFNCAASPENPYARFSIPSRLTEMAAAGMPIFCIAGPGTEARRFVETRRMGVCANRSEGEQFHDKFLRVLSSSNLRAQLGRQARKVAEAEFDLNDYQNKLYRRLCNLAHRRESWHS